MIAPRNQYITAKEIQAVLNELQANIGFSTNIRVPELMRFINGLVHEHQPLFIFRVPKGTSTGVRGARREYRLYRPKLERTLEVIDSYIDVLENCATIKTKSAIRCPNSLALFADLLKVAFYRKYSNNVGM